MSSKIKDKVKASQIEWRRNQVISMRARGINQSAIARELQVSDASISLDIQFLKEQSQQVIKQYTTHDLPLQYQIALNAPDLIIERSYKIVEKAEEDNMTREELSAMELFKDTHLVKLELLSNATTIDSALNFIRSKQQSQQKTHKDDDSSSTRSDSQLATVQGKQSVF
ncbi:MAG: hypothetical protein M3247_06535 [Thermoproteota archaeon]|nr:hypothetical protein [Thermoproteota archaeon]